MKSLSHCFFNRTSCLIGCIAVLAIFIGGGLALPAFAANYTVCPSGCDFTTITNAVAVVVSPDTIHVGADYASTTETFPFNLPNGVTLDCQNSGAVIGVDDESAPVFINSQSDNIFRNCTFSNVVLQNTNQSNVQIIDNVWRGNSRIDANTASNITITGNTATGEKGLRQIATTNASDITISSNTIMSYAGQGFAGLRIDSSTSVQVTSNIIQDNTTTTNVNYDLIGIINGSYDVYFASNTVSEPYLTSFGGGMSVLQMSARNLTIADNTFQMNGSGGGIGINLNANDRPVSAVVRHNTFVLWPLCSVCNVIQPGAFTSHTIHVTSTYNLIVSFASSSANNTGHYVSGAGPSSNLFAFTEYDGFVNLNVANDPANFPAGTGSVYRVYNPLKTDDATTTNDYEQAPWSAFLDVNGALDIGARPGVRENVFQVDAAGTIDYATVDATNTTAIISHLRSNDTVNLAAGTYSPIVLVSTTTNVALSSGVSILGAGSNTVIHASSTGNAVFLGGMTDSIFRDFRVTGASSTATSTYKITRSQFSAGGTDYDDGSGIGFPNAIIIAGGVPSGGSCNASLYDADNFDVTTIVAGATDDWNLFLIDYFGNKLTLIGPDRFIPDAATAVGCGAPASVTVEHEVISIYTVSSGVYTYNAAAAALAGVSPKAGETNPPRLDRTILGATEAGIALNNSSGNMFTNVTSTENSVGVSFTGTSTDNLFADASLDANSQYDIRHETSGSHTFADSLFDIGLVSITGNGFIQGKFSARVFTQNSSLVPAAGVTVNGVSANSASATSLVSGGDGYSPYSSPLPAFSLSSSSISLTSGGLNPYTWTSVANSFYSSASVSASLSQPRQTVALTLTAVPGSGGGGGSILVPQSSFTPSVDPGLAGRLAVFAEAGLSPGDLVKLKDDGSLLTQEDSTVYELGADGRRHAFPNPSVFNSRYCTFANIRIVDGVLARIPLGSNMTYFPGMRLVKFLSVPTVYLVQSPNVLRAIPDEATAVQLAGSGWSKLVSDISDAFYLDYTIGVPIASASESLDRTPPMSCPAQAQKAVWPFSSIPTAFSFNAALAPGAVGLEVRYLQEVFVFLGSAIYPEALVTGVYGASTEAAVKRFQASKGLQQLGIVGPATRAALNAILDIYR